MKRILILIESLRIGGAERALTTLLKHIDKSRYDITVLSIADGGYFSEVISSITGIKYQYLTSSRSSLLDKLKIKMIYRWLSPEMIYRLFIPKQFDVEIAFCEGMSTRILGASNNTKAKRIAWVHTDLKENNWPVNNGVFSNLGDEVACYYHYTHVVGVSDTVSERLQEVLKADNITRIYNLVDTDEILEQSNYKSEFEVLSEKINIVSVGRLEYVKGYDRLINVVSRLRLEGYNNFTLTIIGGGSQMQSLTDLIKKADLDGIVTLTGPKNNPYAIMKGRDLFVCPSRNEGFNIAIAEAMVLGLPVISTWCPGPNEILQEGKFGVLCENNEDGLYKSIKSFLSNPLLIREYSELSKNRTSMFDKETFLNNIYQLL